MERIFLEVSTWSIDLYISSCIVLMLLRMHLCTWYLVVFQWCWQVIQAGKFDQKSTSVERKALLEAILETEQEDTDVSQWWTHMQHLNVLVYAICSVCSLNIAWNIKHTINAKSISSRRSYLVMYKSFTMINKTIFHISKPR